MKKRAISVLLLFGFWILFFGFSQAVSFSDMDSQGVSLKAGPSDPDERLSIAWIESALYPKNVEKGREIFVEVKVTSKVKKVFAQFDFDPSNEKVALYSDDGLSWSRVYKTPDKISSGIHVAKIVIEGKSGATIKRTLDFAAVEGAAKTASDATYDVSVIKTAPVVENGETVSQLLPGVRVSALYKAPFYRVKLSDGKEGWVEASKINEPAEEQYLLGYRSFIARDWNAAENYYKEAIRLDPAHLRARYWLAKTYKKLGKDALAVRELREVINNDKEFQNARKLALSISEDDFKDILGVKVEAAKVEVLSQKRPQTAIVETKTSRDFVKDSVTLVQGSKTNKGTSISAAIKSVLALTRSLGSKIYEDGWNVTSDGKGFLVRFACRQERGNKVEAENFDWKIDPDRARITPISDNSRLLMNRW